MGRSDLVGAARLAGAGGARSGRSAPPQPGAARRPERRRAGASPVSFEPQLRLARASGDAGRRPFAALGAGRMQSPEAACKIAESLVERGIAAGASAADALYAGDRSSSVEVRLGDLDSVDRSEGEQIGLRLFDGQRSATVASSDLSEDVLATLVERCLAMAREAPEDAFAGLAPSELLERGEPAPLDLVDQRGEPDPQALRARAFEAEAAALAVAGVTNSS